MTKKKKDRAAAAAAVTKDPEEDCLVAKLFAEMGKGNVSSVNALLDAGASVDGCFESNHAELNHAVRPPPLVSAALDGNINAVDLLIERGADVDAHGSVYRVVCGDDVEFKMLVVEGTRPLHAAVEGNSFYAVRSLLRNGADPNARDGEGYTPLLRAAAAPSDKATCAVEIAKVLIKGGADVGVVNKHGNSSLLLAVLYNNVRMVEELLQAGGDCSVANRDGATALTAASQLGNTELVRLLLSAAPETLHDVVPLEPLPGIYGTALYAAACSGHKHTVEFLLDAGAKQPTFSDERIARCPLVVAVYKDHPGIVAILLRKKGLEAIGGVSCIPAAMDTAVRFKRIVFLQMLLNVEGEDRKQHWARSSFGGRTMLHWAVWVGNLAAMSVLLAAGADETATTGDLGLSPYDDIVPCSCCGRKRDLDVEAARYRMLSRGPAFRARSWAWPATTAVSKEETSDGPSNGGVFVVWSRRAPLAPPSLGVRIYRPESTKHNYHHTRLLLAGALYGYCKRNEAGEIQNMDEYELVGSCRDG